MWLGSIEIAEKKHEQRAAPVYMYMFVYKSNLIVTGTDHRLGAAHATEIWYKFNNVALGARRMRLGSRLSAQTRFAKKQR